MKAIPATAVISTGETLRIETTLYNPGSAEKLDVQLTHQIIDPSTNEVIVEKIESTVVENTESLITGVDMPEDTAEGRYIVKSVATFNHDGTKKQATSIAYVTVQKPFHEEIGGIVAQETPNLLLMSVLVPAMILLVFFVILIIIVYFVFVRKKDKEKEE